VGVGRDGDVPCVSLMMRGLATPGLCCVAGVRCLGAGVARFGGFAHRSVARAGSVWPDARPSSDGCCWRLHDGGGPEEAGELACDGDGGDVAGLAALA
jgi:hypothetical protein